jgi:hypothetical protein
MDKVTRLGLGLCGGFSTLLCSIRSRHGDWGGNVMEWIQTKNFLVDTVGQKHYASSYSNPIPQEDFKFPVVPRRCQYPGIAHIPA